MKEYLKILAADQPLSESQTFDAFELLLSPDGITDAQIGTFLFALSRRLPTVDELVGAARSLRKHVIPVTLSQSLSTIDTCGTGGSGLQTFNTSTAVGLLLAACGVVVVKHGNRAMTSPSGSADVLEALGVKIDLAPQQVATCVERTGFGFCFAPMFHPATKRVGQIRRELGMRTIFNLIGPLTNPAGVGHQLLGVSDQRLLPVMAEALQRLGVKRALIVRGDDGLDEITTTSTTQCVEVWPGELKQYSLSPEMFGVAKRDPNEIAGYVPAESAKIMREILSGKNFERWRSFSELVLVNAGAALYLADRSTTISEGVEFARKILLSGKGLKTLEDIIEVSRS